MTENEKPKEEEVVDMDEETKKELDEQDVIKKPDSSNESGQSEK